MAAARSTDATGGVTLATPLVNHAVQYDAGQFPLLSAAESGDVGTVSKLLEAHANVNERTADGWSALIMAAKEGHANVVKLLLMNDAAINPPKTEAEAAGLGIKFLPPSHTPLRGAAITGQLKMVKMLLKNEADPNQPSAKGLTPLMGAARSGHMAIVDLLCASGATPGAMNEFGETARAVAEARGHVLIAESLRAHESAAASCAASVPAAGLSMGQAADLLAGYLDAQAKGP